MSPASYRPVTRVLIVEDDPLFQTVILDLLREIYPRISARCCATLDEACDWLSNSKLHGKPFDLLVADQFLPDGYGLDLWKRCLKQNPEIQFILTSGLERDALEEECGSAEVRIPPAYVPKQHGFRAYRDTFRSLLEV